VSAYDAETATVPQQWRELRRMARQYSIQELKNLSMRWPALEFRHPPSKGQLGGRVPGMLEARTVGTTKWRSV